MGFLIGTASNSTSILSEMTLTETQENCAESEALLQEGAEAETENVQTGLLKGEKEYLFVRQESAYLSQKTQDFFSNANLCAKERPFDFTKSSQEPKEQAIKNRQFEKLDKTKQREESLEKQPLLSRTDHSAQQALQKGRVPQSAAQLKETASLKQQQSFAKTLENRLHRPFASSHAEVNGAKKEERTKEHHRASERQLNRENQATFKTAVDAKQEQLRNQEQWEEEGFAEGQNQSFDQEEEGGQERSGRGEKVDATNLQKFVDYAAQDSCLSEIFKMRVSQFDVLCLFIEILKLEIKSREQERIARQQERELQILHMQKVVETFKDQSKWTKMTSIGSGVMAILSGAAPIVGHMKGDWIIDKLGTFFESIRNMEKEKLIKSFTKITQAMSEMQKNTGQIQNTFADATRTHAQHMSDLHRSEWEEQTRRIDDIKDSWKGIENFLYQALQMYHDAIRQLYSHSS